MWLGRASGRQQDSGRQGCRHWLHTHCCNTHILQNLIILPLAATHGLLFPNLSAASKVEHQQGKTSTATLALCCQPILHTSYRPSCLSSPSQNTKLSQQTLTACGRRLRCCLCLRRCCACSAVAGPAAGRWWPPHCWYPDPPSWTETQTAAAAAAGAKCPVDRLPLTALQHLHTQQQHHYSSVHCTR